MKIGLIKDFSKKFDGYNWHNHYANHCRKLGIDVKIVDFNQSDWLDQINKSNANCYLWRAWHVPWDRDNAKRKIYFIEKELKKIIFPTWDMYFSYDDKIMQNYLMILHKIPHPKTFISNSFDESIIFLKNAKLPIVSKASDGAMGVNNRLIKTRNELKKHIDQIFSKKGLKTYYKGNQQQRYVYFQEFINSKKDLRVITIGNKVVLSFWRESENWRKNISQGGHINTKKIPKEALNIARDSSKKLKMHWCAYDIIRNEDQYQVLEFSSVFGFSSNEYIEKFGAKDAGVLKKQVKYLKKYIKYEKD